VTFYLDASFVVSLFISDTHTEKADRWIAGQQDEAIVSELCASRICCRRLARCSH
jgi:DNA-directed RNA polymerase subunit N (RpoN/RPB10)